MKKRFCWFVELIAWSLFLRWVFKQPLGMRTHDQNAIDEPIESIDKPSIERACKMRHYEYFQGVYYNEEKRKDGLMPVMSFVVVVIGIIGSLMTFYFREIIEWLPDTSYKALSVDYFAIAYLTFTVLAAASLVAAVVCLIRSYFNYTYRYLPSPLSLRDYYNELLQAYPDIQEASDIFESYLTNEYAEVAHDSDEKYIRRRKFLHLATGFSILSLVFLSITVVPFLGYRSQHPKKPTTVLLQNDSIMLNAASPLFRQIFLDVPFDRNNLFPTLTLDHHGEKTENSGTLFQATRSNQSPKGAATPAPLH